MKPETWWNSICNSDFVARNLCHLSGIMWSDLTDDTRQELTWLFETLNAESGR